MGVLGLCDFFPLQNKSSIQDPPRRTVAALLDARVRLFMLRRDLRDLREWRGGILFYFYFKKENKIFDASLKFLLCNWGGILLLVVNLR